MMNAFHLSRQQSRRAAFCGILTAASIVILCAGSIVPAAAVASPLLAMVCLIPVCCEYGPKTVLLVYTAVSILAILLCTDKELALFYVFVGWYPALRPLLLRLPRVVQFLLKCGLFTLLMTVMYTLMIFLFQMEAVIEEFAGYSYVMLAVLLVMGNATFLLQDIVLGRMTALYQRRRRH